MSAANTKQAKLWLCDLPIHIHKGRAYLDSANLVVRRNSLAEEHRSYSGLARVSRVQRLGNTGYCKVWFELGGACYQGYTDNAMWITLFLVLGLRLE
jgi:hypothetical protein